MLTELCRAYYMYADLSVCTSTASPTCARTVYNVVYSLRMSSTPTVLKLAKYYVLMTLDTTCMLFPLQKYEVYKNNNIAEIWRKNNNKKKNKKKKEKL